MSERTLVSVVIAARGRVSLLRRCLLTLSNQTLGNDCYEILIGAYGPAGEFDSVLDTLSLPNCKCWYLENRSSLNVYPRARNVCIRRAEGRVIVVLDSDMLIGPDYLRQMYEPHEELGKLLLHGLRFNLTEHSTKELDSLDLLTQFHRLHSLSKEFYDILVAGGNNSVERGFLHQIRGYDEDFTGYAYEDIDLNARLESIGLRAYIVDDAVAFHQHHESPFSRATTEAQRESVIGPNRLLYEERKGILKRNTGYEWGSVQEGAPPNTVVEPPHLL